MRRVLPYGADVCSRSVLTLASECGLLLVEVVDEEVRVDLWLRLLLWPRGHRAGAVEFVGAIPTLCSPVAPKRCVEAAGVVVAECVRKVQLEDSFAESFPVKS